MDSYTDKYIKAIQKSTTPEELSGIVNKIYKDGFADGLEAFDPNDELEELQNKFNLNFL